jgi:hypothetical protein
MSFAKYLSLSCAQARVEHFVAVFDGDPQVAIRDVNTKQQVPSACVIGKVAYMRGSESEMARHGDRPHPDRRYPNRRRHPPSPAIRPFLAVQSQGIRGLSGTRLAAERVWYARLRSIIIPSANAAHTCLAGLRH